jgi:hypothetical protein
MDIISLKNQLKDAMQEELHIFLFYFVNLGELHITVLHTLGYQTHLQPLDRLLDQEHRL